MQVYVRVCLCLFVWANDPSDRSSDYVELLIYFISFTDCVLRRVVK